MPTATQQSAKAARFDLDHVEAAVCLLLAVPLLPGGGRPHPAPLFGGADRLQRSPPDAPPAVAHLDENQFASMTHDPVELSCPTAVIATENLEATPAQMAARRILGAAAHGGRGSPGIRGKNGQRDPVERVIGRLGLVLAR